MGPFFARLASSLENHGQSVTKVNFNGGDAWFYRRAGALSFRGSADQWPTWLRGVLQRHRIDALVLFGQTRPLHAAAVRVAQAAGIAVYVFEEGYLRPDYVTLERGGVNAHSSLPRCPETYPKPPHDSFPTPRPTGQRFRTMAGQAMQYSMATWLAQPWFPLHRYHRPIHPVHEAARWLRGGWRKLRYGVQQRNVLETLTAPERSKRWFLLPLQVANDSQIVHHSRFDSVGQVIVEVLESFALHAPQDAWLVIKHHPMDRAYNDYTALISQHIARHGLHDRVLYVHDLHLPTMLKNCRGVVTVNSTAGLQALYHGVPVCTLSDCFYAIPGLVHALPLSEFWTRPGTVDASLYRRFHHHVVAATQLNASFYGSVPALEALVSRTPTGTLASEALAELGLEPAEADAQAAG